MPDHPPGPEWKRMSFKGNKVWVALEPSGAFLENNGKVKIKYNLKQDYEYWVPRNSVLPEEQAVSKKKAPNKKIVGIKPRSLKPEPSGSAHSDAAGSSIVIYTDGASSGNPGPAGIGVVMLYGKHEKEISEPIGIATNNQAELTAILRALQEVKRRDLPVRLHSDSSYCLGLLTKGWKPQANQEIVRRIKELMADYSDLELIKVRGHSGIQGNERADALATQAAASVAEVK